MLVEAKCAYLLCASCVFGNSELVSWLVGLARLREFDCLSWGGG